MYTDALQPGLGAVVPPRVWLTILQALTVAAFLAVGIGAVRAIERAFRDEDGRLRRRESRFLLASAAALFTVGFAGAVAAETVSHESLAALALGFAAVASLLYGARPELFDRRPTAADEESVSEKPAD
jgi:uncharacterized membrane protein YgdD (TMEM256/DUF423 family)